ncbi:MAG: hypothetical protein ABI688_07235, partial [Bacteroidota bacterium]
MQKIFLIPAFFFIGCIFSTGNCFGQLKWQNVDSLYQPLPASVHVYFTDSPVDTGVFRAYYLIADLEDKKLGFTVDTARNRRLIPSAFYERNNKPLVVVNTTFFSYETNRSLNVVIKEGEIVAFNSNTVNGRGKDTFTYRHVFGGAIGISKKRKADIAWLYTDSLHRCAYASQWVIAPIKDSLSQPGFSYLKEKTTHSANRSFQPFKKWKMRT